MMKVFLLVSLRLLLHHQGSLYTTIYADKYGPFYYLAMSTLYRVIHQEPSLENGRLIVLALTAGSAALFGASVWRVTKNLPCSVLCEVGAFLVLIYQAGDEPMHPGSLGVLLLAVVLYALSSYSVDRKNAHLVVVGAATGALVMTKINVARSSSSRSVPLMLSATRPCLGQFASWWPCWRHSCRSG